MDEQMIEDMRDTIESSVAWQTGEVFKGNLPSVNYLEVARAAHSVIAGKVAELEAVRDAYREGWLVNAIPPDEHEAGADYVRGCEEVDWQASKARAALAPHPKARNKEDEV